MKTQMLDRNGILKPIGMLLIIILLSVCCCTEYLFAQKSCFEDQPIAYCLCIKEVTIFYTGYELPKRIVNPIEPSVDIDILCAQLMEHKTPYNASLSMYADNAKVDRKKRARKNKKVKIPEETAGLEYVRPDSETDLE